MEAATLETIMVAVAALAMACITGNEPDPASLVVRQARDNRATHSKFIAVWEMFDLTAHNKTLAWHCMSTNSMRSKKTSPILTALVFTTTAIPHLQRHAN